ncbi:MAG: flp type pilus assembly protein [Bryobacterales bacterium]|nr:flp type pilus assembly protein [Bryobacterales bacterium]
MLTILIALVVAVTAMGFAVKLLRGSAPEQQVQRRLKTVQQAEFATIDSESSGDFRKEDRLSLVPWFNRILIRLDVAARLRLLLQQAGMERTVGSLLMLCVFTWIGAACLLYLRLWSVVPAIGFGLAAIPLPFLYVLRRRAKRFQRFESQMPEAIDMLVSALRAGHSLMTAIGFMGQESREPLSGEFRKCFEEQNYGAELRTALLNLGTRMAVQDLQIFIAAVLIQKESGGRLAEVLEKVAQTSRERFRLRKQVQVHTAQGRMTGWILSLLPVALGFAMYMVHPDGISLLWKHPVGLKLLYTAVVMNVLGALAIRKIVRIRV